MRSGLKWEEIARVKSNPSYLPDELEEVLKRMIVNRIRKATGRRVTTSDLHSEYLKMNNDDWIRVWYG